MDELHKKGIITFQMLLLIFNICINYYIKVYDLINGWGLCVLRIVNKGLVVRLYPDEDMQYELIQNIGNARFTWNMLLDEYQKTYTLFKQHGYNRLNCNMTTFNTMLTILKKGILFFI